MTRLSTDRAGEGTPGPPETPGASAERPKRSAGQRLVRFGILGAARIVPKALTEPAQQIDDVDVLAIAARDCARAREFALGHRIPRVLPSYIDVIEAHDIDAIYIPLPNSLHCEWTIRALRAGKHVLCEKPLAANAREAERMAAVAADTGLVLAEALHYRYHPLTGRVLQVLREGTLGRLERLECEFSVPTLPTNIRFDWKLAGGATMDLGCYLLDMVRYFSGVAPRVRRAQARIGPPGIDITMEAELELRLGAVARISCSMDPEVRPGAWFAARGDCGELLVTNVIAPHGGHLLTIKSRGEQKQEIVHGDPTYFCQLKSFVAAVRGEQPIATDGAEGVLNMRLIDEVYKAAGLPPRGA
jgi:predicted dehydrogenase